MKKIIGNSKGSALVAVLAVLFILLAIFFSVFAFAVSRSAFLQKKINLERASYLADAGINHLVYLLSKDSLSWNQAVHDGIVAIISPNEKYEVKVNLSGAYLMASSTGVVGVREKTRKALIGLLPWRDLNTAVINGNSNYPLVLAGQSQIRGDVIVGPESVTRGTIEGEMYSEDSLIIGRIYQRAAPSIPRANVQIMQMLHDALFSKSQQAGEFISGSAVLNSLNIAKKDDNKIISVENNLEINSLYFNSGVKDISIFAGGNIELKGRNRIEGPIELISNGFIIVGGESHLDGVLLFATDSIVMQDKSWFRGQAICGKAVRVKGNSRLDYPSLLYVWSKETLRGDTIAIEFMPGTVSRTLAFVTGAESNDNISRHIMTIDTGASVTGLIYSQQFTQHRGLLKGISITDSYWFYKAPTTYINWLKDAVIDRAGLDFLPVLPVTFPNQSGYAVFREFEDK